MSEDNAPDIDYTAHDLNEQEGINDFEIKKGNEFTQIVIVQQHFDIDDGQKPQFEVPHDKIACQRCTFHNELTANICEICESPLDKSDSSNIKKGLSDESSSNDKQNGMKKSMMLNVKPSKLQRAESRIIDPREILAVGDKIQVYSESAKKWCNGRIHKVHRDENEEWLTVKYAKYKIWDSLKDIGRYSENLRPIEVHNAASIVMCTGYSNDTEVKHDSDETDSDHEYMKILTSKTRLKTCKPDYFIQILSILEENVTIRLDVKDIDTVNNRTFVVKDIDKDIVLNNIVVYKNWPYGTCKFYIYDDIVGDSYRIAIFDRNKRDNMLSNDIRFTKHKNDKFPPPFPVDIDKVIQVVQDDERLLYWNTPNQLYGDDIWYKIIFENQKNDEVVKSLPYSLRISKYSECAIRIKTMVTIFDNDKYQIYESLPSKVIHIENMRDLSNHEIHKTVNSLHKKVKSLNNKIMLLEDKSNNNLKRIESLEQINDDRRKYFVKLNDVMDNILSNKYGKEYDDDIIQMRIIDIYDDKYQAVFFKTLTKEISMAFFDAKIIDSQFVAHKVPIKSKKINTMTKISEWTETFADFIELPFVSNVIKIYKNVSKYGYDKYVLKISAKYLAEFELKYCKNGGMAFGKRMALILTESNRIQQKIKGLVNADDVKQDDEKNKKIEKLAKQYSEYLLKLISTGYADKMMSKLDNKSNDIMNDLALMVLLQSLKEEEIKWVDAWNSNDLKDLTKETVKESKDLAMEMYQFFGTNEYLQEVVNVAKQFANDQLHEWGYNNIPIP